MIFATPREKEQTNNLKFVIYSTVKVLIGEAFNFDESELLITYAGF